MEQPITNSIELDETIEKHDQLNPKLFNANGVLREEVRAKLLEIVNNFIENLEEDGVNIIIDDILLIGSNASYNYTANSDIDLHILADTSSLHCPDNLYPVLYSAYRSLFNKQYDISIYGIPVELYVETDNVDTKSNGIYSIKEDEWIKEPEVLDIPEVDQEAVDKASENWKQQGEALLKTATEEDIDIEKIYLDIINFIDTIYNLRKQSLKDEGEYSTGNLVFKELRNIGLLDKLKDAKSDLTARKLTLESLKETLDQKKLEEYKHKIMQLIHIQPLVQSTGYFSLHNIRESEIANILHILQRQDFIKEVHQGAFSRYDFSRINPLKGPQRLMNIEGQFKNFLD